MNKIDVHHHVIPDVYRLGLKEVGVTHSGGKSIDSWSVQDSLAFMEEMDIEKAYCSISEPALYPIVEIDRKKAALIARETNEFLAKMKADHPEKFGVFGLLPMPDVESSIEETVYCLDTFDMDGIGLLSNYYHEYLGNDRFDPLFRVLNERNAIIYVHPSVPVPGTIRPQYMPIDYMEEFTFHTTRAATNLIFSGTLQRYPNLRFIFSHMGGTLPYLKWRLDHTFSLPGILHLPVDDHVKEVWQTVTKKPSQYMKQYYFDTALSTDEVVYRTVSDISPNNILFGSDSFYASRNSCHQFIKSLEGFLSENELEAVYKGNAENLFGKKNQH